MELIFTNVGTFQSEILILVRDADWTNWSKKLCNQLFSFLATVKKNVNDKTSHKSNISYKMRYWSAVINCVKVPICPIPNGHPKCCSYRKLLLWNHNYILEMVLRFTRRIFGPGQWPCDHKCSLRGLYCMCTVFFPCYVLTNLICEHNNPPHFSKSKNTHFFTVSLKQLLCILGGRSHCWVYLNKHKLGLGYQRQQTCRLYS